MQERTLFMLPVAVQTTLVAIYSSAAAVFPPAISTRPLASGVAVDWNRPFVIVPLATHASVVALYRSASTTGNPDPSNPPATRTSPDASPTAYASVRLVIIGPASDHVSVEGS